jgi:Spy/CpxP family protein refolding chaperone
VKAAGGCGSTSGGCGGASNLGNSTSTKQPAQLNLTSYQQKKLDAIDQKYGGEMKDLQTELAARKQELSKLVADPKSSEDALRTAVYGISDLQAQLQLESILVQRAKNKVYTPGQRELLSKPSSNSASARGGTPTPQGNGVPVKTAAGGGCGSSCGGGGSATKTQVTVQQKEVAASTK